MTYNHALFIKDAIDSVMMQRTNFVVELVVGDDFSQDGTLDIIRQYKDTKDKKIRILERRVGDEYWKARQKKGRLYNFQDILGHCKGKYIALLDGDDYWTDPLKLQKQVDFLETNPSFSGVFHETQVLSDNKSKKHRIYGRSAPEICTTEDTFSTSSLFHTSAFLFRQSSYEIPEWHLKVVSGDMALFSIVSRFGPLKKIPELMSVYRKHDKGITSTPEVVNNFHQKRIELIRYLDAYHNYKHNTKATEIINEHLEALDRPSEIRVKENILMRLKKTLRVRTRLKNFFSNTKGT